jgi:DnaJ-class molecular chaperone
MLNMDYKYFNISNNITLDELKKQYRKLCLKYHPDKGGNTEIFQAINREYKEALEFIKQKAYESNDTNYYKLVNEHLYSFDNYIKKLNVPKQFKPAITFLVEKGINELGRTIKNKLAKHE